MSTAAEQKQPPLPVHKQILAGAIAGTTEIMVMYPTDVVKTRLQLQTAKSAVQYSGMFDCFRKIVATEGASNLYRGIISPIFAEAPKRAVKFTMNEQYKRLFAPSDGSPLTPPRYFAAGASAGITEAFVNCPFEVVKVRMQSPEFLGAYKSTTDATIQVLRKEGVAALYKGLEAQLWRNASWNGTYFGLIGTIKSQMATPQGHAEELQRNFLAGLVAGTVATSINTPFDVAKSRLQNQSTGKLGWTLPMLATIVREEGVGSLWKGFGPRLFRLGPGGGIMLVAFEAMCNWLR
eukprot:TRINITY_DN76920_c0_g1_i1.p1 TRINITY_DN76920_c0_g1~~TRINITY_DN76920_c0_g1_i1.p1  ORF type:complete len:312 (+),score=153.74 TRINITY_DN76920_c0_g1_i1:63-938(+)